MAIAFYAEDTKLPAIKKRAVGNWVKEVAATYGKKVGDISYIFCSDEKILEVNRQYLQHDYYTDIITFDYTSGDKISGTFIVDAAEVEDAVDDGTVEFLVVGSVEGFGISLHRVETDKQVAGEREIMEANENKALAILPEECRES